MVFNATFNNISVISRRSVLLVEETGVHGETRLLVSYLVLYWWRKQEYRKKQDSSTLIWGFRYIHCSALNQTNSIQASSYCCFYNSQFVQHKIFNASGVPYYDAIFFVKVMIK